MNFDFSDDLNQLREQARRFLKDQSSTKAVRAILEGGDCLLYTSDAADE